MPSAFLSDRYVFSTAAPRWDPADTNGGRSYSDGRGLNSVQILSFLRVAEALTGNATYGDVADGLKADYG